MLIQLVCHWCWKQRWSPTPYECCATSPLQSVCRVSISRVVQLTTRLWWSGEFVFVALARNKLKDVADIAVPETIADTSPSARQHDYTADAVMSAAEATSTWHDHRPAIADCMCLLHHRRCPCRCCWYNKPAVVQHRQHSLSQPLSFSSVWHSVLLRM